MKFLCCDNERRRNAIKDSGIVNGIDFLEVSDDANDPIDQRERTLFVHFIKPLAPGELGAGNVRIEGGERIRNIQVLSATVGLVDSPLSPLDAFEILVVQVNAAGDFSTYSLRLIQDADHPDPPAGFDPELSVIDFSFKASCPSDFDCQVQQSCPTPLPAAPELDYLAKDYASFRQLMLDRLSVVMPQWKETSPADLGIVLVELLAYVADYLSYQQDATATEAYLGTARRRVSVKRHARLIDYFVHEGATARVWVQAVAADGVSNVVLAGQDKITGFRTRLITRVSGLPPHLTSRSPEFQRALAAPATFELVNEIPLFSEHNTMQFYTWGSEACCLPKGATTATLLKGFPNLKEGTVLIFSEVRGPLTGDPEDADPTHRCAVRLSADAVVRQDPIGGRFHVPPDNNPVTVTEIQWNAEDALPFPLCISARQGTAFFDDVSVALGNIVLADYGATRTDDLPPVPQPNPVLTRVPAEAADRCHPAELQTVAARYRPALPLGPVTHVADYKLTDLSISATAVMRVPDATPQPAIYLRELNQAGQKWQALPDLLGSNETVKAFVLEVESDGTAYLRFGDDQFGERPVPGLQLQATYRIGNGAAGNLGAESLAHIISDQPEVAAGVVQRISNPMPAAGGIDPETIEQVRQRAPSAFRAAQERAVTPDDYAEKAQKARSDIQRAAATFRWTGSWRTVFVSVDRLGGAEVTPKFQSDLRKAIEPFRMAGHDLEVNAPIFVPLQLDMTVCVDPAYFISDVRNAILAIFNNGVDASGRKGLFHADRFSFGQPVFLSPFYAAAQAVDGVRRVDITRFERQNDAGSSGIDTGRITMSRLEIARLDNDPNFRERGFFNLTVQGGR
jgi:hypothetical protein